METTTTTGIVPASTSTKAAKGNFNGVDWLTVCVKQSKAQARSTEATEQAWNATGRMLWEQELVALENDGTLDKKDWIEMAKTPVNSYLQQALDAEIPEVVDKDGKPWKTRDKNGIKFRSLPYTANQWKYLSTIFGAIYVAGLDEVFPNGKIRSKSELDAMLKNQETPEQAVKRGLKIIEDNYAKISNVVELEALVTSLMATYMAVGEHKTNVEAGVPTVTEEVPF